jgi:hypothetical protein
MSTTRRRPAVPRTSPARGAADAGAPVGRSIPPKERARLARTSRRLQADFRRAQRRGAPPRDELLPELEGMGGEDVSAAIAQAMEREGVDPALVYAFRKTGLVVTAETAGLLSAAGRKAWAAALQEFRDRQD